MNLEILKANSIENWRNKTQMPTNESVVLFILFLFWVVGAWIQFGSELGYLFNLLLQLLKMRNFQPNSKRTLFFLAPFSHRKQLWIFFHVYGHIWTCRMNIHAHTPFSDFISRLWLVALDVVFMWLWHRLIADH